jgi:hypothetical protein
MGTSSTYCRAARIHDGLDTGRAFAYSGIPTRNTAQIGVIRTPIFGVSQAERVVSEPKPTDATAHSLYPHISALSLMMRTVCANWIPVSTAYEAKM